MIATTRQLDRVHLDSLGDRPEERGRPEDPRRLDPGDRLLGLADPVDDRHRPVQEEPEPAVRPPLLDQRGADRPGLLAERPEEGEPGPVVDLGEQGAGQERLGGGG